MLILVANVLSRGRRLVIVYCPSPQELAVNRTLRHRGLSCVILAASLIFNPVQSLMVKYR